jgi:hypothetical protein
MGMVKKSLASQFDAKQNVLYVDLWWDLLVQKAAAAYSSGKYPNIRL